MSNYYIAFTMDTENIETKKSEIYNRFSRNLGAGCLTIIFVISLGIALWNWLEVFDDWTSWYGINYRTEEYIVYATIASIISIVIYMIRKNVSNKNIDNELDD